MSVTEAQLAALEGNIRNLISGVVKQKEVYLESLYHMIKCEDSQFTDMTMGSIGPMTPWTGAVDYSDISTGYTKQYRPVKYSKGIIIQKEVITDKNLARAKTYITDIAQSAIKKLRNDTAAPFINAFGTSAVGADGAGLCSAAHHIVPGDAAQSNTGSLELTYENLNDTLIKMSRFTDDNDEQMLVEGDTVICGYYWLDTLKKLFGAEKEAFTADNTINTRSGFKYICHPLILTKNWFVVDSTAMKSGNGLNFWMREDPRNSLDSIIDKENDQYKYFIKGRWDKGWTSWHWCYGHQYS